jgi:predicted Zn-dependent protease
VLAFAVASLATACATPPPKPRKRTVLMSDDGGAAAARPPERRARDPLKTNADDSRVGRDAYEQVAAEMGLLGDAKLDAYVTRIGERLLRGVPRRGFDYRFAVVDQIEPNAFALPGGYVFVSRGLLALVNTEDELANVIGHEITHAASRHAAAQQAAAHTQNPLTMPWLRAATMAAYSRDMERDADRGGQLLAAAAGYDPMGMSTFLGRLGQASRLETGPRGPSFFDSHPGSVERASVNAVRAGEIRWRRDPSRGDTRVSHLQIVEGLPVGPRREGGVFEGERFLHPELAFQLQFPQGWRLQNTNRAVGAMSRQRDAVVYLAADQPKGELEKVASDFVEKETQGRGRIQDSRAVKVGSLDAWRIEFSAAGRQGSVFVLSTFFSYRDSIWRITGMSQSHSARKHRGRILATTRSFRPLPAADAARVGATRLHVVQARAGEDLESLRKRTGSEWSRIRIAILNGLDATRPLEAGEPVKIAVRGS